MDYHHLLIFHSYYRWMVLAVIFLQFLWLTYHRKTKTIFLRQHLYTLLGFTILYNIQLIIGWCLFLESSLAQSFWDDVGANVKHRQMRFFGLEHISMMTLSIVSINVLTYTAKRRMNQVNVFGFLWKGYLVIYLIILSSIPWSFSPLTSRPNFR